MRRTYGLPTWSLIGIGLAFLAILGTALPGRATTGPILSIRLVGGGQTLYPIDELQWAGFSGDTLILVKAGVPDRYALETIAQMDFFMDPTGIKDPRAAAALIKVAHLFQNQPNPFSPETQIAFDLSKAGPVELGIYSVGGRLIRRLVKDTREAGPHTVTWDGRDGTGVKVSSGIYFYQLTASGTKESRRMILLP